MSDLLKPKVKVPEPQGAPPTVDEAARAQDYSDRVRKRRGRASTIMVPSATPATGTAAILGG